MKFPIQGKPTEKQVYRQKNFPVNRVLFPCVRKESIVSGIFLLWLRLHTATAGNMSSIRGGVTKILHATQHS